MRSKALVRTLIAIMAAVALLPQMAAAATHIVTVGDNFFSPSNLTIQVGDTVEWRNASGGNSHNVTANDASFQSETDDSFTFSRTFNSAGTVNYNCTLHSGMNGTITVMDTGFEMNAGLNGNWDGGASRAGEGFNLEISKQTNNNVLVAQVYSYDTSGNQVWLLAVGPVNGDSAAVTVYIFSGAKWGDDFVPADAVPVVWGTGLFVANSCDSISMSLTPNSAAVSNGFTDIGYDLVRVTTPLVDCPSPPQSN